MNPESYVHAVVIDDGGDDEYPFASCGAQMVGTIQWAYVHPDTWQVGRKRITCPSCNDAVTVMVVHGS